MNNAHLEEEHRVNLIPTEVSPQQEKNTPPPKPSNQEITERYLTVDGMAKHAIAMTNLLEGNNYKVTLSADSKRIDKLDWEEKRTDFVELDKLFGLVRALGDETSKHLSGDTTYDADKEFAKICFSDYLKLNPAGAADFLETFKLFGDIRPEQLDLEELLHDNSFSFLNDQGRFSAPLLEKLTNEKIETSEAHTEKPAMHVLRVSALLKTGVLNDIEAAWVRVFGMYHDTGKEEIANYDHFQYHAEISYLKLREYLRSRKKQLKRMLPFERDISVASVDSEQQPYADDEYDDAIEQALLPIRYHHAGELMGRGILTKNDLMNLIKTRSNFLILSALSIADAASVNKYMQFGGVNAAETAEIMATSIADDESMFSNDQVQYNVDVFVELTNLLRDGYSLPIINRLAELDLPGKLRQINIDAEPVEQTLRAARMKQTLRDTFYRDNPGSPVLVGAT